MGAASSTRGAGSIFIEVMDLDKYIRPDGSTYYAISPADPGDKPFVETLPGVDVFPKKKSFALLLIIAAVVYGYSR